MNVLDSRKPFDRRFITLKKNIHVYTCTGTCRNTALIGSGRDKAPAALLEYRGTDLRGPIITCTVCDSPPHLIIEEPETVRSQILLSVFQSYGLGCYVCTVIWECFV